MIISYLKDKRMFFDSSLEYNFSNLLETLKEQLTKENNGVVSESVSRCSIITIEEISLNYIKIGNRDHLERVEPRKPVSPTGSLPIIGVLVRTESRDKLVDGYHRYKYSLLHRVTKGFFIVLS